METIINLLIKEETSIRTIAQVERVLNKIDIKEASPYVQIILEERCENKKLINKVLKTIDRIK